MLKNAEACAQNAAIEPRTRLAWLPSMSKAFEADDAHTHAHTHTETFEADDEHTHNARTHTHTHTHLRRRR